MRCPKCGYNSFDHLDNCKKCGKDLANYKQQYGIKSVLFPGLMRVPEAFAESEMGSPSVAEKVAAATATAAAAKVATESEPVREFETAAAGSSERDDFGFDFMGESEEEDDLSFDELFEEAPADEDVEETLPEPEQRKAQEDDFSFDTTTAPEEDKQLPEDEELADDFGFDLTEAEEAGEGDFDLPPPEDDDFNFDEEESIFDKEQAKGTEEDPKDPFDLPGFSLDEEAPEARRDPADWTDLLIIDDVPEEPSATVPASQDEGPLPEKLQEADAPVAPALPEPELPFQPEAAAEFDRIAKETVQPERPQEVTAAPEVPEVQEQPTLAFSDSEPNLASEGAAIAEVFEQPPIEDDGALRATEAISYCPPVPRRILAFICDLVLLLLVGTSFLVAAEAVMAGKRDSLLPNLETMVDLSVPYFLVLFSLTFGYFTLFHFLVGQTPGKMLAGLRVETLDEEPLVISQAFLRSVGGLLQLLPLGLGYLLILKSGDGRGWNDQLAGTRLVDLKQIPAQG